MRSAARVLGMRLIKLKMTQIIPLAVAVAGGGFKYPYDNPVFAERFVANIVCTGLANPQ